MDDALAYAETVMERAEALGTISEEPGRLTRRVATPAMRQAINVVVEWMRAAGMFVRVDNIGNVIGRYDTDDQTTDDEQWTLTYEEGQPKKVSKVPTLIIGSHLDTVRDAGKYDGPLGLLVGLAAVQRLHDHHQLLPFAIEVVAFADEEGLRFHTAYLGSKAFVGMFDQSCLLLRDEDGISLEEAIAAFSGRTEWIGSFARSGEDLIGYVEVHIEQGPVLEAKGLPVGVVSGISGQNRVALTFTGEAGHAGTVPMHMRHDALAAAAEFVLAVESLARSKPGFVATVGQTTVEPGASNVIPGRVVLSLDIRHSEDGIREQACLDLLEHARQICDVRRIALQWQNMQETRSVPCSPRLSELLANAVEEQGSPALYLASGAGHDAVIMSSLTEVAMLFVRCKGGISHNPAESVEVEDVAVAIEVLDYLLQKLS